MLSEAENGELCSVWEQADNEYLSELSDECGFLQDYLLGICDLTDSAIKDRVEKIGFTPQLGVKKWAKQRLAFYREKRRKYMQPLKLSREEKDEMELNCVKRFLENDGKNLQDWKISKYPTQDDDIDVECLENKTKRRIFFRYGHLTENMKVKWGD